MASRLRGAVRDAAGQPVAGATVYFVSGPASLPDVAAQTGADGSFDLSAPVAGAYRVAARGPSGGTAEAAVEAGGDGSTEFDLHLRD